MINKFKQTEQFLKMRRDGISNNWLKNHGYQTRRRVQMVKCINFNVDRLYRHLDQWFEEKEEIPDVWTRLNELTEGIEELEKKKIEEEAIYVFGNALDL